jgi:Cof subfamily protein (haloacid dehalogenase superfamily)
MTSPQEQKNMRVRLVIADVDGTLVTQEKVLTPRAIEVVRKLHAARILFAITSGRPPRGMKMLVEPLQLTEPMAGFNGGAVTTPDLKPISVLLIEPMVAGEALQMVTQHGLGIFLYSDLEWYVTDPKRPHVEREQKTVQFPPKVVPNFESLLSRVVKIVGVSDDLEAVARCEKDVQQWSRQRVSAARSQPYYLDITHMDANKGQVVLMFSKLCNVPATQIATIGDMPNDVLMFEKSGVSIAMGNASPEVQKRATYVTASNEEDGFAKAMEQFILGQPGSPVNP